MELAQHRKEQNSHVWDKWFRLGLLIFVRLQSRYTQLQYLIDFFLFMQVTCFECQWWIEGTWFRRWVLWVKIFRIMWVIWLRWWFFVRGVFFVFMRISSVLVFSLLLVIWTLMKFTYWYICAIWTQGLLYIQLQLRGLRSQRKIFSYPWSR